MSGPIIRKYGFPNHESIFGKKEVEHGVEEQGEAGVSEGTAKPDKSKGESKKSAGTKKKGGTKKS